MWDFLLHLWAKPPANLPLTCPPPADGQIANPVGYYDDVSVRAAYNMASLETAALVLVLILICYLWTRQAGGPRFKTRWWIFFVISVVGAGALTWLSLTYATVTAIP